MTIKGILVTNGKIIGAVLLDNGQEKRARLSDVQKLIEKKKITEGAFVIDNHVYFDADLLKNHIIEQPHFEIQTLIRNDDGKIVGADLTNGKHIDVNNLWSLIADNRISGLKAVYFKETNVKALITI